MKNRNFKYSKIFLSIGLLLTTFYSCERELSDDAQLASFSKNGDVFIDTFSAGLDYLPYADSKQTAFSVDTDEVYDGSASMRFDIPNVGDPQGAYAGAIFKDATGRDLSGYDALTFWAKATQAGTIDQIGFGQDFEGNNYQVAIQNLHLTTNWVKYTIPIPDSSVLTQSKGLFWYAEGPENGNGYSFWVDELKYEKLGTVAQARPAIFNGEDLIQQTFIGVDQTINGLTSTFNLGSGQDVTVVAAPAYFVFESSNPSVATVDEFGLIKIVGSGTTVISATLAGQDAAGSLTLESLGNFTAAPVPTRDASNVISIFSDAYTNVPVDFYNGYFAPFQTTQGQDDIEIDGNNIIQYTDLNFVATEFKNPTINVSDMTHFHADVYIEEGVDPGDFLAIELGDFGPDNVFGGGNDSSGRVTFSSSELESGQWISFDIPLTQFGLPSRSNLAQIFFISDATISTILVDNMYFYKEEGTTNPSSAFPIDFEDGLGLTGAFDNGASGSVENNPVPGGINTSAKVYQFNKIVGSAWYSGAFNIFEQNLDLSQGTTFKLKIYSPTAGVNVRFQIEKEGGGAVTYSVDQTVGEANTWTELTFDFSTTALNPANGYDKIVIFPDFDESDQNPVAVEAIYFIDDIVQTDDAGSGGGGTGGGGEQGLFPIDFEDSQGLSGAFDNGATGSVSDNPDPSGINTSSKVYQFNKVVGSAWYSGTFNIFDENIDLSQGTTFTIKIYSATSNVNIRFQLEKEGGGGGATFAVDQTLAEANTWVEMTFDFSTTGLNPADAYDKIVIFFDYDESDMNPVTTETIYYIDDITQQ